MPTTTTGRHRALRGRSGTLVETYRHRPVPRRRHRIRDHRVVVFVIAAMMFGATAAIAVLQSLPVT